MREIKFRCWSTHAQFMASWEELVVGGKIHLLAANCHPYPVMQYTGLKDCNGVEIYEGDIVQFTYWWFDGNVAESTLTGEIVYNDSLMSFQLKGVKNEKWEEFTGYENDSEYLTSFSELNFEEADFEVIGNIHEHPELLK